MTPSDPSLPAGLSALAESVRRAILEAGEVAYEDAGTQGLCADGRWEAAVAAMRSIDVESIARRASSTSDSNRSASDPKDAIGR